MKVTLVLLPGLNGTKGLFASFISCAPDDIDILSIEYPVNKALSYEQLSLFVMDKLESINGSYVILGESFSGPLSLFIAEKNPLGLIGLILVATFITSPNVRVARFLPWTLGFSLTKPLYDVRGFFSRSDNTSFIQLISAELQKVLPSVLAYRIQQIFMVNAVSALKSCDIPIMYFRGTKDFVVPERNLLNIQAVKPDIEVVRFKTQHFLLQSAPKQAWGAIERFVTQLI
ncbi:3-oxoadipate enol-lactone hydrolase/4-carboxymuconolactone decarboxylase [gamma proteobacterium IMCC1989]|nr:3-oxoadipate enol-lactone hydrolase/4-carboxymuconolactone decarboxylase [gamma proteobacterium IMCC1989]